MKKLIICSLLFSFYSYGASAQISPAQLAKIKKDSEKSQTVKRKRPTQKAVKIVPSKTVYKEKPTKMK